jgi:hypothetical protein
MERVFPSPVGLGGCMEQWDAAWAGLWCSPVVIEEKCKDKRLESMSGDVLGN